MMSSSSNDNEIYLAAIEGGGTTFVVSVARVVKSSSDSNKEEELLQIGATQLEILRTTIIPPKDDNTGEILNYTPAQILSETCDFLTKHLPSSGQYSAVGIATFGPAGVNPESKNYGSILPGSPKREWRNVDILTPIAKACGLENDMSRVLFDTDVNAPAIAEFQHRNACATQSLTSLSYITIGTGVGVGLIINSQPVHGLLHPEGGHVAVQPLQNDTFAGYSWGSEKSPYGGVGTVEGICSSVALTERYLQMEPDNDNNKTNNNIDSAQTREVLSTLPDTHEVWDHAANAIANLCVSILLLTSCEKIVLGGGIMKRTILYKMVRQRVCTLLNGYLDSVDELSSVEKLENVICESSWEKLGSGLVGAYALALQVYEKDNTNGTQSEEVASGKEGKRRNNDDDEQHLFTSGVLTGIGLSFCCLLLTSFLSRGSRHRY